MAAPPRKTRDRLLDAALVLFLERGVAGTTVTDIERAVGLAAGTGSFYRHFPSKEAIVVPAFSRGLTMISDEIAARRARPLDIDDAGERMKAELLSRLDDMHRIQPFWTLLMLERSQFPDLELVFVETLGVAGWAIDLATDSGRAITLAALTGFNQLAQLNGSPYRTLDPVEFVTVLVELATNWLSIPRPS